MALYKNQTVDFIGLVSPTLEGPLVIEGDQSNVVIGSTDKPALGPLCAKFNMVDNSSFLAISDNELILGNREHVTIAFAYSGISIDTPINWGELWTVGIGLSLIGFTAPIEGKGTLVDGLCRAYWDVYGNARVMEAEDMADAVARCVEVENSGNYFVNINYRRNIPEAGIDTMRIRITQRGTGVILGEKTYEFANPTGSITRYVEVGLIGYRTNAIPYPQSVYFTDFVVDYTNAQYPILDYILTFDVVFDSQSGSAVPSQVVENGALVLEPADPTRTGYVFDGWYSDSRYGTGTLWDFATNTVSYNITLYAKWVLASYAVSFDSLGGSAVSGQTIDYEGLVSEPVDPTRERYAFSGWYADEACTTAWIFATDIVTGPRTLYAKWTIVSNRVSFNSQGGSAAPYEDIAVGEILGTVPVPYRAGFNFLGWFTQPLGSGSQFLATTIPTADVTLYASWLSVSTPVGEGQMVITGEDEQVNEGSTITIEASFFDETGAAMVPSSILWSLYSSQGGVVHGRTNVPVTPAAAVRIVLSGLDNVSTGWRAEQTLVIKATYNSTDGSALPLVGAYRYFVNNVKGI